MDFTPFTATLAVWRIAEELATLSVIHLFRNWPRALPKKDIGCIKDESDYRWVSPIGLKCSKVKWILKNML